MPDPIGSTKKPPSVEGAIGSQTAPTNYSVSRSPLTKTTVSSIAYCLRCHRKTLNRIRSFLEPVGLARGQAIAHIDQLRGEGLERMKVS